MVNRLYYLLFLSLSLQLSSILSGLHLLGVLGGLVGVGVVLLGEFTTPPTPTPQHPTTPAPIKAVVGDGDMDSVLYNEAKTKFKTQKV